MDTLTNTDFVQKLNNTLKNGGVIAFVTDTVWGVGCLPECKAAVDRIYGLKGRDTSKPLILMSNSVENLRPYVENISQKANNLIDEFFPGALTLIFQKSEKSPLFITSQKNTVGIRVPNNETFAKLCEVVDGHVLATTSANLSNQPSAKTYEQAKEFVGEFVDFVLDDFGEKAEGLESTVVTAVGDKIAVLRQGAVDLDK